MVTSVRPECRGQWPFYGATAVLYESYLGSASGLQAFLELLPDSVDIPRHWGPEDLAAMQYSETAAAVCVLCSQSLKHDPTQWTEVPYQQDHESPDTIRYDVRLACCKSSPVQRQGGRVRDPQDLAALQYSETASAVCLLRSWSVRRVCIKWTTSIVLHECSVHWHTPCHAA